MDRTEEKFEEFVEERFQTVLHDLSVYAHNSDLFVPHPDYTAKDDTYHMRIIPRQECNWGITAYKFGRQKDMKVHRAGRPFPVDGQPRVVIADNGIFNYARYVAPYDKFSDVSFEVVSRQPSHYYAERELAKFYGIWKHVHGYEPIDVLRKLVQYYD
jgi:hypothetical protein